MMNLALNLGNDGTGASIIETKERLAHFLRCHVEHYFDEGYLYGENNYLEYLIERFDLKEDFIAIQDSEMQNSFFYAIPPYLTKLSYVFREENLSCEDDGTRTDADGFILWDSEGNIPDTTYIKFLQESCKKAAKAVLKDIDAAFRIKVKELDTVYFILFPEANEIKIGYTSDLYKRLSAYKTHAPSSSLLLGYIEGNRSLEKQIHEQVHDYKIRTELFKWNDEIQNIVSNYIFKCLTK